MAWKDVVSGNEPITDEMFWTFVTMDITPPLILLLGSPFRSNPNIFISWTSDEEVSFNCTLVFESKDSPVELF